MKKPHPQHIERYVDLMRQMPPPSAPAIVSAMFDLKRVRCFACQRYFLKEHMPQLSSCVVPKFCDNICFTCRSKEVKKWYTVVCTRCKEVAAKGEPRTDNDGFTYQAGQIYHVVNCAGCCPGLKSAEVVEHILWRQRNHLPIPSS